MKPVSEVTALVFDHGLFMPLALELAKEYDRVLYYTPWERGFPTVNDCILGDGFDGIERCNDFWPILDEIDLFVFPDIQHAGLQLYLESIGKPVWGSHAADSIEIKREKFLGLLKSLGLPCPEWVPIDGLTALRDHLKDKKDKFIKISRFRGSMETWHWRSWEADESRLDQLAVDLGPAKEQIRFLVFEPIDAEIEVGYDGYCIDGQFPKLGIQGYEAKDRGFLCRIQQYDQLPRHVQEVNAKFGPELAKYRYRNFWSTEIRVTDEGEGIFIDPCCRCPSPSTEAQLSIYGNTPEIVWHGAHGELIEPVPRALFSASAALTVKDDRKLWLSEVFPKELDEFLYFLRACRIGDATVFPASEENGPEIGWLSVGGNTPTEAVEKLIELSKQVPDGVEVHTETIADLIKQIDTAQEQGVRFSKDMPSPGIVAES